MNATSLVVDCDLGVQNYLGAILTSQGHKVVACDSVTQALDFLRASPVPKYVFVANCLPDADYLDVVRSVRSQNRHADVIILTFGHPSNDWVTAIRAGATRVLSKPFLSDDVISMIRHARDAGSDEDSEAVTVPVTEGMSMVYASSMMRKIHQQADLVARVSLPVLILGESGTGKEVIARYVHRASDRARNNFLKVNCAAVPPDLLESELFGYEKGAFTGASQTKPGKFKLCDNGTMFLDEIGEMHPSLQAKLLQVLQDGTFSPLGSRTTEKVNVRIIAATNIDMKAAIANKQFREDLYYRINGFSLTLPPLRERSRDIPVLLRYFLHRHSQELGLQQMQPRVSHRLLSTCVNYEWPGNLRELESFVKRYLVLGDEELMVDELTRETEARSRKREVTADSLMTALQHAGGNRRKAAESLNISYKVLLHRLREFGLEPAGVRYSVT